MATLKDEWKIVGKELGATLEDLGEVLTKTAQVGIKKLDDWLNTETGGGPKK